MSNKVNTVNTIETLKRVKEEIKDLSHPHLGHIEEYDEREATRKAYDFAIKDVTARLNHLITVELINLTDDDLDYIP